MPGFSATIQSYLDALPRAEDSYPECSVKASLVRNAVADKPIPSHFALPPVVRALVDAPPPVSVWVSEVHFNVVMYAIREHHFGGDRDAFLSWVYAQNRKLFDTTLYRAIFFVVSPERLLVNMEKRWGSFRTGTELRHRSLAPKHLELIVRAPANLYTLEVADGMSVAVRAAIDAAGANASVVTPSISSPTEVRFDIVWK